MQMQIHPKQQKKKSQKGLAFHKILHILTQVMYTRSQDSLDRQDNYKDSANFDYPIKPRPEELPSQPGNRQNNNNNEKRKIKLKL